MGRDLDFGFVCKMASAESGESKPAGEEGAAANPEHINLKVMGQDGNIVQFKIKKHTALKKLMSTYCERAGLALQTIRFSFDGTRINEGDTPKGLDMEDGDTIEVFQQQSGGGWGGRVSSRSPRPLVVIVITKHYASDSR